MNQDSFNDFVADFKTVLPQFVNVLTQTVDPEYDQSLKMDNQLVIFNGIGDNAHETFYFERVIQKAEFEQFRDDTTKTHLFNFTKTARKPYDIAVCSALIIAKKHFGEDIFVSSDGNNEEWTESKELCQRILGYGINFDMDYDSQGDFTQKVIQ